MNAKLKPRKMMLRVVTPTWWVVNNWARHIGSKNAISCMVIPLTDDCVHGLAVKLCRRLRQTDNVEKALASAGIRARKR